MMQNSHMERAQKKQILTDLKKKMVFLTGPRQVGKTWLAKDIARHFKKSLYLNYDSTTDRAIIRQEAWLDDINLLVFDELHKMKGWKNYLKGVYDTKPDTMQILVTGSARLEAFRQQGDSMAGRFFRHRLLPFSPSEMTQLSESFDINSFIERGGFPEPFLSKSTVDANRWRMQYIDGLIRTDVLDFERIHDVKAVQLTLDLLRSRTGSPISYQSLSEDVGVSPNTVKKYIQIFESLFIVFRITPYSTNIARSIKKAPKIYFYDTGMVDGDAGAQLENLVAVCLLKSVCHRIDTLGEPAGLCYIRTKDGAEVDFCLTINNRPERLLEVKRSDPVPSNALANFSKKYHIPADQVVFNLKHEHQFKGIHIRKGLDFLASLP